MLLQETLLVGFGFSKFGWCQAILTKKHFITVFFLEFDAFSQNWHKEQLKLNSSKRNK